jgi:hypothetical protein
MRTLITALGARIEPSDGEGTTTADSKELLEEW